MHLLNTAKLLHENPYTGDRITKASIIHLEPSLLRDTLKAQQQQQQAYDNNTNEKDILSELGLTQDRSDEPGTGTAETRQKGPELVAIKFLSSSTSCADGFDSSFDDDEDDEEGSDGGDTTQRQRPLAHGWTAIGYTDVPQKVKFGLKAKREIAALRAAQGHPNVVPFLGFTGHKKPNLFHKPRKQEEDSSPAHLGISSGPLGGSLFGSALPLGRSLFHSDAGGIPTSTLTLLQPSSTSILKDGPQNLLTSFRQSSEWDSDDYDSDASEDVHEIDPNSSVEAKLYHFHRIFSRQPGPGGIILPLVHNSLQDLIQIGWTKTRPFMVETCMRQILEGLAWIHDEAELIHRDISAGNILVTIAPGGYRDEQMGVVQDRKDGKGRGFVQCLISDFGCATFQSASDTTTDAVQHDEETVVDEDSQNTYYRPKHTRQQGLTFEVGTRAYRAPELLFSSGKYTNTIDIWSAGVLYAEMYLGKHLFEADSDIGQVCAIVKVLGTPTEENWPEYKTMPDYGKLIFRALETNDLASILFGSSSSSASKKENKSSDSLTKDDDDNSNEKEPAPPTLISKASFRLIELMVTFSGARRPSARQALSEIPSFSSGSFVDENGEPRDDGLLRECILDVQQVLNELQRLKAQEADESDDDGQGGGGGMFIFGGEGRGGGGYGANAAGGQNAEFEGGSDDDDDGQRSIRSDDFSRYDFQSGTAAAAAAVGHNDGQEQGQQFGRVFDEYDGRGHEYLSSVSVSEHGKSEVTVGGIEEEDGGPVRAVKRHRGVSEGDSSVDG
ncbi:hypothetical protein BGZ47_009502 [Haplosporangium gracile]|nr:hypothetical protein BGZ47_009502 [Haplosporangium gracile]